MGLIFRDDSGETRISGDLLARSGSTGDVLTQQADGTFEPAAGGGGSTARAQYGGNAVTIANGATGTLTIDTKFLGDDLLDLSDPANPTVVTAGVYSVSVTAQSDTPLTAGGSLQLALWLDNNGDAANSSGTFPAAPGFGTLATATCAYYIPADGVIFTELKNHDGTNSVDFNVAVLVIQRLS